MLQCLSFYDTQKCVCETTVVVIAVGIIISDAFFTVYYDGGKQGEGCCGLRRIESSQHKAVWGPIGGARLVAMLAMHALHGRPRRASLWIPSTPTAGFALVNDLRISLGQSNVRIHACHGPRLIWQPLLLRMGGQCPLCFETISAI